jgi:CheY-like chemotaxis protein
MVVNGYSDLLLDQLAPLDPMYEPIAQIKKAGHQAAALTRQLLMFSRRQNDEPAIISLNSLLLGMTKMLGRFLGEDIEIVLERGSGPDSVRSGQGQIEQIIMNLAINARDAMPHGGKLLIETSHTTVDDDLAALCLSVPAGKYVVISVSDTGIGMTPEVQARVFEPFFTTKGPDKGTGLGLSTVYGIVKHGGGTITVHSSPGVGTTFRVFLPSVEGVSNESHAPSPAQGPAGGSETILLVEDQAEVRGLIRDILEDKGYRTLDAASGDDAIAIASRSSQTLHLLITDMVLPGMNGAEIVAGIRAIQPGIRVLKMSGYTDRLALQSDDGTSFIQKPFTGDALLKKIREILDAKRSGE